MLIRLLPRRLCDAQLAKSWQRVERSLRLLRLAMLGVSGLFISDSVVRNQALRTIVPTH